MNRFNYSESAFLFFGAFLASKKLSIHNLFIYTSADLVSCGGIKVIPFIIIVQIIFSCAFGSLDLCPFNGFIIVFKLI